MKSMYPLTFDKGCANIWRKFTLIGRTRWTRAHVTGCWAVGEVTPCAQLLLVNSVRNASCFVCWCLFQVKKLGHLPEGAENIAGLELEWTEWFGDSFITCHASWSPTAKVSSPGETTWDYVIQFEISWVAAPSPSPPSLCPKLITRSVTTWVKLWYLCAITQLAKVASEQRARRIPAPANVH